jgi:hypothetical protein
VTTRTVLCDTNTLFHNIRDSKSKNERQALAEGLRPDNPLAQAPYLAAPFSLTTPGGIAALNAEVTSRPPWSPTSTISS